MRACQLCWILVFAVCWTGCAMYDRAVLRKTLLEQNIQTAKTLLAEGRRQEAAQIFKLIAALEGPQHAAGSYADAIEITSEPIEFNFQTNYVCGSRINRFSAQKRGALYKIILCYPVNVLLDLMDVISLHVGTGGGVYADLHVTRAIQLDIGAGSSVGIDLLGEKRSVLLYAEKMAGFAIGPVETSTANITYVGFTGGNERQYSVAGFSSPFYFVHQFYRDYWEVGVRAVVPGADVGVAVHLSELADALLDMFGLDILNDSIGDRPRLKLSGKEKRAILQLIGTYTQGELRERLGGKGEG